MKVDINESGKRNYTFMDSYQNQTKHFDFIVKGMESVLTKNPGELENYLLDVYDADNYQFNDLYTHFFDLEGNIIPDDKQLVKDPRHQGELMPRGCYDDNPHKDQHEWISSKEYAVRHGDDWSTQVEDKFNALNSSGLLDNPNERTMEHMTQLLITAKFIENAPGVSTDISARMKEVRESLDQKIPSVESHEEEQIVIKILSKPIVPTIDKQISNLQGKIDKLEQSIKISTNLIDKLTAVGELQLLSKSQSSLLDKAKGGLIKKLVHLEALSNRLELAQAHQQKYAGTHSKEESPKVQQAPILEDSSELTLRGYRI